jgi:hypothetical protein
LNIRVPHPITIRLPEDRASLGASPKVLALKNSEVPANYPRSKRAMRDASPLYFTFGSDLIFR